ncbi:MAG: hypothetical protein UGE23_07925 [Peptococcaceae bacterium]|nr:hypothetical protein [Peptococcaceae bacterium]
MTTSLKDVSSAQMVHALAEMNCFEQECTVYGYGWYESDTHKICYTISDDEQAIRQSFENKALNHYAMTPIQKIMQRTIITEEIKDQIYFLLKLKLAEKIKTGYSKAYYNALLEILNMPPDSLALPILHRWKDEIDGYYDKDEIILYEGALDYAYLTQHLTDQDYDHLCQWVQQYKLQLAQSPQTKDNYTRTFWGFAYELENGSYKFVCNANQKVILEKLGKAGHYHTPIFHKEYYYHMSNELKDVRKSFETKIQQLMDATYLERMQALRTLPGGQRQQKWLQYKDMLECNAYSDDTEGYLYWGRALNLIK